MATNLKNWLQIGVWGDSLVHGGIDNEAGGWVCRLKLYLMKNNLGDHCFSMGIGGQNSTEVMSRIDKELFWRREHVDHVLISVGLNDLINPNKLTSLNVYADNLRKIILIVRAQNKVAWLLSPTPASRADQAAWKDMVETNRQVALEEKVKWIDLSNAFPFEDLIDGVHPGPSGHQKIFLTVKKALTPNG
jgi:lysophospholipase L1-like esterase